ncbi:fibrinogen C domain-containing protein 1-A [Aplysia californica]|uniref:Fibrinogen C domain-containing protein 1-A n=1 Tax=Aplysia californica TaxID=6500 RepID=A0ABM0JY41_APLCA|nr:fibrinogen C domain-containing protein 1-A [Aplysia californica]
MGPDVISGYILLVAAILSSCDALVLHGTTAEVEIWKTKNVSLECMDNDQQPDINSEVIMMRILKKDHDGWSCFAELRDGEAEVTPKRKDVLAEANKTSISDSFLRLTWPVATDDTTGEYRCDFVVLTSQENFIFKKSQPTLISRKSNLTVQILNKIMEENKREYLQRLRSQREIILENVTVMAEESKTQCMQQKDDILQNFTAIVESFGASFESKWKGQLQVLSRTVDQNKRECPHQMLSQKRQILEHVAAIMEQTKEEIVQQKEDILINVTAVAEQAAKREFAEQREDLLNRVTATTEQTKSELVQQEERILNNLTAIVEALEANFERKLGDLKIKLQPKSCSEAHDLGPRPVIVLSDGMKVVCDTVTDHGGWIVIQRRASAAVDFYRDWADYKNGFGDFSGNFWFGLEKVHQLTSQDKYELRIDMKYEGDDYYAKYKNFKLSGESEKYKIQLSGFSGNVDDKMSYHDGQEFTTKDQDNDFSSSVNCAVDRHGAWWYDSCHYVNLNGYWGSKRLKEGMNWYGLTGEDDSVSFSEMKIRRLSD